MKTIEIISSKSDIHRWLIGRTLAKITGGNVPEVFYCNNSEDVKATEECGEKLLELSAEKGEKLLELSAEKGEKESADECCSGERTMFCGESASTLRFFLPIMGALGIEGDFLLEGRLPGRPLDPLIQVLSSKGMTIEKCFDGSHDEKNGSCISVWGKLEGGEYVLPGNISSQYASGLLMALPLLKESSKLRVLGPIESKGYLDMTLNMLREFSIEIEERLEERENPEDRVFRIRGNQVYSRKENYTAEGDWSNAAFFLAAGILGEEPVMVKGLKSPSLQKDSEILDLIKAFGGKIEEKEGDFIAYPSRLRGIEIDGSQIPDLVPILALLGARAEGTTKITKASRLRFKESDRLKSTADVIGTLGGHIKELEDGLIIQGLGYQSSTSNKPLLGGKVNSHNDHRIAMMAQVASLISLEPVIIEGKEAVNKSYPEFYNIWGRTFL